MASWIQIQLGYENKWQYAQLRKLRLCGFKNFLLNWIAKHEALYPVGLARSNLLNPPTKSTTRRSRDFVS